GHLAAPQGAQGGAAGDRPAGRNAPHLPPRPEGSGRPARRTRPVLESGASGLQGHRRKDKRGGFMSTPTSATTVHTSVVVEAPIDRAFRVFTEDFGSFKPPGHNMLGVEIAETVFEPRVGGHLYDRGVDGSECRWARILVYEPPTRVVFSWDISPSWQVESDLNKTSEVEVQFIAETAQRTRVELEHRNLERHGDGWEGVRAGVAGDDGWPLYLRRYAGLLAR